MPNALNGIRRAGCGPWTVVAILLPYWHLLEWHSAGGERPAMDGRAGLSFGAKALRQGWQLHSLNRSRTASE